MSLTDDRPAPSPVTDARLLSVAELAEIRGFTSHNSPHSVERILLRHADAQAEALRAAETSLRNCEAELERALAEIDRFRGS